MDALSQSIAFLRSHIFSSLPSGARIQELWFTRTDVTVPLIALFCWSKINNYWRSIKAIGGIRYLNAPFANLEIPGLLWNGPRIGAGWSLHWTHRRTLYLDNEETVAFVPYVFGSPEIYTRSLEVAHQVELAGHETNFQKPQGLAMKALKSWGMNLLAAEREMWRKHRRVVGPAFNNALYKEVLKSSVNVYEEMIVGEGWEGQAEITVQHVQPMLERFSLLIIGICGFGFESVSWNAPPQLEGKMDLAEAIETTLKYDVFFPFIPRWSLYWSPFRWLRAYGRARLTLEDFMKQQITSRQTSGDFDDKSAFSLLLKANADPDTKYPLDEEELIGNVFLFLLAGHETTAKTLTAVMSLLAIHPEVQKDIISEIREVLGTRRPETLDDIWKLEGLLGALLEALRLFPPGALLFREVRYDTVVSLPPPVGMESRGPLQVPVLKGTKIYTDFVGIHRNERYFPEPEEFKPTRWAGISPDSEQLSFFSFGPRVCIGKRFALVELLAFLSCFIRDFEINPYLKGFENVEQWASKMKEGNLGVTLSPKDVPFVFKRRSLV